MTSQYPPFPPGQPERYQSTQSFHPNYVPKRRSRVDAIFTAVLSAVAVLAALGCLWYSLFFAMVTDACGEHCNDVVLGAAYVVTWGGVAIAGLGAIQGVRLAERRGWVQWIWPAQAICLMLVSLLIGAYLADSVAHHS